MKALAKALAVPAVLLSAAAGAQSPYYEAPRYQPSYEERYVERPVQAAARAPMPQRELDRILAPVALYPDSLLSQLLIAATFPRDVAEAAAWSRANPGLQGEEALRAVDNEPWDPSVKSLAAFPDLLKAMGDQPQWTDRLGQAFAASEGDVLRTVQELRARADRAGSLRSDERLVVERDGPVYVVEQASPEVVYVPYYDPRVVYGDWWWPGYSPVFWSPWPGYLYRSGYGFGWGRAVPLHRGHWHGRFDWHGRNVRWHGHDWRDGRGNGDWRGRRDGRNVQEWRNGQSWRDVRDGRRWAQDPGTGAATGYTQRPRPQYQEGVRVNREATRQDTARQNPTFRTVAPRTLESGYGGRRLHGDSAPQLQAAPAIPMQQGVPFQRSASVQGEASRAAPRAPRVAAPVALPPQQALPPRPHEGGGNARGHEGRGNGNGNGNGGGRGNGHGRER